MIVKDLLESGYDGGISMEPHMAVVFHDKEKKADSSFRRDNYFEYGRRFMNLLKEIGQSV